MLISLFIYFYKCQTHSFIFRFIETTEDRQLLLSTRRHVPGQGGTLTGSSLPLASESGI